MTNKNIENKFSDFVPLPVCFVGEDGKIKKASPRIGEVFLYDKLEGSDIFVLTGFSMEQLTHSARTDEPLIFHASKKTFKVSAAFAGNEDKSVILYFTDISDFEEMQERYKKEQACYAIVNVDNYDELVASTGEDNQSSVMSKIDRCIRGWGASVEASVTRYKNHMYIVIFENSYFQQQERSKFPILDEVREVETDIDFPITLSIGIGMGGRTPADNDRFASEALDLALARGGDQAVVKENDNISFYGGKTQTVEKGNKGKSRIIGYALFRLIETAKNVIIMGHENPDMDCFGAALGIYRMSKPHNKNTFILVDRYNEALSTIYDAVIREGEYDIIRNQKALQIADRDTLLIVVDTHRPSITECPELLDVVENVAVIDHHRKGGEYIAEPTLAFTEPYASSASELVTEILEYTIERRELKQIEAEALLAGIMVDTNRFSVKTGVRTLEAAAWLKRAGADTSDVKKFFQVNRDTFAMRSRCIAAAEFDERGFAYSICEGVSENAQIINSQAADELLSVDGVRASFVAGTNEKGRTVVSARSMGSFNVQTIMEKFDGGGHMNTAGAQMDISPEEAIEEIKKITEKIK